MCLLQFVAFVMLLTPLFPVGFILLMLILAAMLGLQVIDMDLIETFWSNVEYYRLSKNMLKKEACRQDRWHKDTTLKTVEKIAGRLGVPVMLLFDDSADVAETSWDIACNELGVSKEKLIEIVEVSK